MLETCYTSKVLKQAIVDDLRVGVRWISNDFLNKFLTIGKLHSNSLLVTLDVSSLYTNIPQNEGINACDHFVRTDPYNTIPTSTICDLIHFLQIHGPAMGTLMATSFANLFLWLFEKKCSKERPISTPYVVEIHR